MQVFENTSRGSRVWSIEVPARVGRQRLTRILAGVPGVRITKRPSWLTAFSDGPFCEFELQGRAYAVASSWPAGERFEIAPDPPGCEPGLLVIRDALLAYGRR